MSASYRICGLGLGYNVPVAVLEGLPRPARIDVRVTLGSLPPDVDGTLLGEHEYFVDPELDERGLPCMRVARLGGGRYYRLEYSEGVTVVVDSRGTEVWATWTGAMTADEAASYVTGSLLGFVLRLRGVTCMHGSAIAIGEQAVALVGPSGSGKSSTAAGFARLGYAVLTDDIIALRETGAGFSVEPALPRVHLWPQSVDAMFGSSESLPRITPHWEKLRLDLAGHGLRFQRAALPLAAIYFLGERGAGLPRIEAVRPAHALIDLVSDSHATEFVERTQRAEEFDVLARLLERVPTRRVTPSEDMARVPKLCEAIARDFERLGAPLATAS